MQYACGPQGYSRGNGWEGSRESLKFGWSPANAERRACAVLGTGEVCVGRNVLRALGRESGFSISHAS